MAQTFQCPTCIHFRGTDEKPLVCVAFPEGIPPAILSGEDHSVAFEGDHGIRYEPKPELRVLQGA